MPLSSPNTVLFTENEIFYLKCCPYFTGVLLNLLFLSVSLPGSVTRLWRTRLSWDFWWKLPANSQGVGKTEFWPFITSMWGRFILLLIVLSIHFTMTLTCFPLAVSAGALMNRMFVVSVPEILLTIFSTQIFFFNWNSCFTWRYFPLICSRFITYSFIIHVWWDTAKFVGHRKKKKFKHCPQVRLFKLTAIYTANQDNHNQNTSPSLNIQESSTLWVNSTLNEKTRATTSGTGND